MTKLVTAADAGVSMPLLLPGPKSTPLRPLTDGDSQERNLMQGETGRIREDPGKALSSISAWASGAGWRAYSDYIGQRIFYEGYSSDARRDLLSSAEVRAQIKALAQRRLEQLEVADQAATLLVLEKQLLDVAAGIAEELCSKMDSLRFIRFFGMIINQGLSRMFQGGLNIAVDEFERLRDCAKMAEARRQSIVFLPCHRSHLDYPHIIAGENLAMPLVGSMLQAAGAVWIRRTFDGDALYGTMVQEYISQLLAKGQNLEVFIEVTLLLCGRSRTGKLLQPKYGILAYILNALLSGRTEDVWFVPISLQYDRVIEGSTYVNELLGQPKEKESLPALINASSVLNLNNWGRIDLRFGKPFSLSGFVEEHRNKRMADAQASKQPAPIDFAMREHKALLLRALGYRVLSDINGCAVIMPAALVSTIILTLRGRGISKNELCARVDWLREAIIKRGGRVSSFYSMSTAEVVTKALKQMDTLIGEHPNLLEPVYHATDPFQLSFYRNSVLHLFVSESLVAVCVYTRVKSRERMAVRDVLRELQWLSQLLAAEFVYSTQGLEANARTTISAMVDDRVLILEDEHLGLADEELASGRERFDTLCFMIWSFIDSYWLGALSLLILAPREGDGTCFYAEKDFAARAQNLAKTLFHQGEVTYLEAVNIATLANAWSRYEQLGIVRRKRDKAAKAPLLIALMHDWAPPRASDGSIQTSGKLFALLRRLGAHRLEGKQRRELSSIAPGILRLVGQVSADLAIVERETTVNSAHL